jgi:predicted transcriptional regulator
MATLGPLELGVMECLWTSSGPLSVRDVLAEVNETRSLAYTTVMTVLDNLHGKNMVSREKHGRAYVYLPTTSRSAYTAELMEQALSATSDRSSALLRFVGQLPPEELDDLRRVLDGPPPGGP